MYIYVFVFLFVHVFVFVFISLYVYVCLYVYVYLYKNIFVYVFVFVFVFICVYVFAYVCVCLLVLVYVNVDVDVDVYAFFECKFICICICICFCFCFCLKNHTHMYLYVFVCLCMCLYVFVCVCLCVCVCMCACTCTCTCVCMCVCVCVYAEIVKVVWVRTWKMVSARGSRRHWRANRSLCLGLGTNDKPNHLTGGSRRSFFFLEDLELNSFFRESEWLEESGTCRVRPTLKLQKKRRDPWVSFVEPTSGARDNLTRANFGKQNWRWPPSPSLPPLPVCPSQKKKLPCLRPNRSSVHRHHAHM